MMNEQSKGSRRLAADDAFTFGIEEEYFVVDARTLRLLHSIRPKFVAECKAALGDRFSTEMLQCQIEFVSPVFAGFGDAFEELRTARREISAIAGRHGLAIAAAGTYPLATWSEQNLTPKRRYRAIGNDLQIVGRRNVLCGLHVHVAPPPNSSRVDLMNRALPFLPIFLALSTSSPFWQRHPTGMRGYRLAAYDELPRTGLPAIFRNEGDYQLYVNTLVASGAIPEPSHIWWAIRPSSRFPTLELRIADSCTYVEDALCIAALFRCLVRTLWRNPSLNAEIAPMTRLLVDENRWRAQRYGVSGTLIDLSQSRLRPFADVLGDFLDIIRDDADCFGCADAMDHARRIVSRGTSADLQIERYEAAALAGRSRQQALRDVCRWISATTGHELGGELPSTGKESKNDRSRSIVHA